MCVYDYAPGVSGCSQCLCLCTVRMPRVRLVGLYLIGLYLILKSRSRTCAVLWDRLVSQPLQGESRDSGGSAIYKLPECELENAELRPSCCLPHSLAAEVGFPALQEDRNPPNLQLDLSRTTTSVELGNYKVTVLCHFFVACKFSKSLFILLCACFCSFHFLVDCSSPDAGWSGQRIVWLRQEGQDHT